MTDFKNIKLGNFQISKVYLGENLIWNYVEPDIVAPTTTIYPTPTVSYGAGAKFWFEVDEACDTYYTLDGSTPTVNSTLFTEPFTLNSTTIVKYFSVDVAGNVEAVKTTEITITATPVTTISPASTIQNTIPFTVSLSATNNPTAIYYRLGTGTQQTYTAPFEVNQSSAGVGSPLITIAYWSVNANGTEAEKTITYDTKGAIPSKAVVSVINGENSVTLNWAVPTNTTTYNIYRSTTLGVQGDLIFQYWWDNTYTDSTAVGGTTYYYTVISANYWNATPSDQVVANPTVPAQQPTGYRYLRIDGYGESANDTTRMIEVEAYVGATNVLLNKAPLSYDVTIDTGSTNIATINDGTKTTTSGTYPVWWSPSPNANVVFDFGTPQAFTRFKYYAYSTVWEQRINQFKFMGSNTNNGTDWVDLWDMSANTTPQPVLPEGYEKIL